MISRPNITVSRASVQQVPGSFYPCGCYFLRLNQSKFLVAESKFLCILPVFSVSTEVSWTNIDQVVTAGDYW